MVSLTLRFSHLQSIRRWVSCLFSNTTSTLILYTEIPRDIRDHYVQLYKKAMIKVQVKDKFQKADLSLNDIEVDNSNEPLDFVNNILAVLREVPQIHDTDVSYKRLIIFR